MKKSLLAAAAAISIASIASTAFASATVSQKLENIRGHRPAWALDRTDQRSSTLDDAYNYNLTGAGVTVYVMDSGINPSHEEFGGRVTAGFSSVNDTVGSNDCNGHGTHSASIIGGSKYGVAKNVTLVPVRVLNCRASGSASFIYPAVNWIIQHHQAGVPAIVNMSVGMSRSVALNDAVRALIADGLIVIGAAGNQNQDACRYSPSSEPALISVGAIDRNNARAFYSNFGSCVDIFAPGSDVVAAWFDNSTSYRSTSGTSNAAPIVSGIAALMLEQNPRLTQNEMAQLLSSSATAGVVTNAGNGSPNLLAFSNPAPLAAPVMTTVSPTTTVTPTTTVAPATTITSTTTTVAPTTTVVTTTAPVTSTTAVQAVNLTCTTAGARVTIDKTSYVCVNVGNGLMLVPRSY